MKDFIYQLRFHPQYIECNGLETTKVRLSELARYHARQHGIKIKVRSKDTGITIERRSYV